MTTHRIAVIAGDGIGKEVMPEGVRVLDAAARKFGITLALDQFDWSCDNYDKHGWWMPPDWRERVGGHVAGCVLLRRNGRDGELALRESARDGGFSLAGVKVGADQRGEQNGERREQGEDAMPHSASAGCVAARPTFETRPTRV